MSSEMRYTDDDLRVIVQDWSESDPDQAVAINLARECLRHRALLARTEAGADRPVAEISELSGAKLIVLYSADEIGHLPKGTKLYTRPQDASVDAEWRELLTRASNYIDTLGGDSKTYRAAMQAKEAK